MNRVRIAALLAAAASIVPGAAASGSEEETTTVGYVTEVSGLLKSIYRPPVLGVDPRTLLTGVTEAECTFDATGYGNTSGDRAQAAFAARVVTTRTNRSSVTPQDPLGRGLLADEPVATGVGCELTNGDGTPVTSWSTLRPGNSAADAVVREIGRVSNPVICVWAWVYFGDGTRVDHKKTCDAATL
ncbi:MAG TPA: hypothetical protein VNA20_00365 [Frankiaceae bacterium]|nr:hypothetical protein [Frankiaceae bacterium]